MLQVYLHEIYYIYMKCFLGYYIIQIVIPAINKGNAINVKAIIFPIVFNSSQKGQNIKNLTILVRIEATI